MPPHADLMMAMLIWLIVCGYGCHLYDQYRAAR